MGIQRACASCEEEQVQRSESEGALSEAGEPGNLLLGDPNNHYEREADAIADQIVADSRNTSVAVQRASMARVQAKNDGPASGQKPINAKSQAGIDRARRSGGRPLPSSMRSVLEPRFGASFSQVRIHDDSSSAALAHQMNAHAFTVGNDVFFANGRASFNNLAGQHLLAHELTHTIQQGGARLDVGRVIQRSWVDNLWGSAKEGASELWDGVEEQARDTWARVKNVPCTLGLIGMPVDAWLANEEISRLAAHEGKFVRRGSRGDHVALIQEVILAWGCKKHDLNLLPEHGVDGKFGKETKSAVKEFQRRHDLKHDGVIGWNTFDALHSTVLKRLEGQETPEGSTGDKKARQHYLMEGASIVNKAQFGWVAGDKPGRKDWADSYDPRFWRERQGSHRIIEAKTTPSVAMRNLVKYIDKPLPNPSGGSGPVFWSFDCLEGSHFVSLYAEWKMLGDDGFDDSYTPLELGMHPANQNWGDDDVVILTQESKNGPVYMLDMASKVPLQDTMDDYVLGAEPGALVVLHYPEAKRRCDAVGGSGDDVCGIQYENTVKVDHGQFSAHPYGVLTLDEIKKNMVREVEGDGAPITDIFVTTLKSRGRDFQDAE